MKVDAGGCRWTKVDGCGGKWMQVDAGGQNWMYVDESGCWQSMTFGYREFLVPFFFFIFVGGIGTGIGKKWYRTKSCNRYPKKLVPEKVSEPTLEKLGTGKKYRSRYR